MTSSGLGLKNFLPQRSTEITIIRSSFLLVRSIYVNGCVLMTGGALLRRKAPASKIRSSVSQSVNGSLVAVCGWGWFTRVIVFTNPNNALGETIQGISLTITIELLLLSSTPKWVPFNDPCFTPVDTQNMDPNFT